MIGKMKWGGRDVVYMYIHCYKKNGLIDGKTRRKKKIREQKLSKHPKALSRAVNILKKGRLTLTVTNLQGLNISIVMIPWGSRPLDNILGHVLLCRPLFPGCSPGSDLVPLPITHKGSDGDRDKDRADNNEDDLPDSHAVEDWWQVGTTGGDGHVGRRRRGCRDHVGHQSVERCIIIQRNLH